MTEPEKPENLDKPDEPDKKKLIQSNESSFRQKILIWLGAFLVGTPVGLLVGLSNSPVVGIVLSAILTTVVSIAIIAPQNKKLFVKRAEVASIMGLCWGLATGGLGGAIERNNGFITRQRTELMIDRWINILYDKNELANCDSSSTAKSDCNRVYDSLELRRRLAYILLESNFCSENDSIKLSGKNSSKYFFPSQDFGLKSGRTSELQAIEEIRSLEHIEEMKYRAERSSFSCIRFILSKYKSNSKSPLATIDSVRKELDKYTLILRDHENE